MLKTALTATAALILTVTALLATLVGVLSPPRQPGTTSTPTDTALADIPADYLPLYLHAAPTCPGLDWSILAGIGKVETDHGRSPLPGVTSGENPSHAAVISRSRKLVAT